MILRGLPMVLRCLPMLLLSGLLIHSVGAAAMPAEFQRRTDAAKLSMMRDPAAARRDAIAAAAIARAENRSPQQELAVATAAWLTGEASLQMNDVDRAVPEVSKALAIVERLAPESKLHADLLLSRGGVDSAQSFPDKALRDYQAAHRIYTTLGNTRQQAIALLDIAAIYQNAEDFQRVLEYCSQAADLNNDDLVIQLTIINNRANALSQLDRYKDAEREFKRALVIAERMNNPLLQAKILKNIALAQVDDKNLAAAKITVARGLRLARSGESATWRPFLLGVSARIAVKEGRANDAARIIGQAFAAAGDRTETQVYRSMHDTAYSAYVRTGRRREALAELQILRRLEDEAQSLAASTNSALLAARFDFANQNTRIATLKAGQLQRDVALSELRARQTAITLGSALLVVLGGLAFLVVNLRSVKRSRDAVAAANAELTTTNLQLEEALRAKSKFLATTSHEIRTPLNGILGMAQVILAEPALAPATRERIELLQGAGTTMRALVDDILDFASLDAGRLDIQRADADLPALLREITGFWRGPATRGGLDLTLACDPGLERISEDVRRLRQILFNLLSNAIKFTPQGQVALRASTEASDDGERLVIAVEDSGVGIPPAELARIFEEFHQVDTGRTRQFSGSGLGLAISRALAEAMGGTLDVASVEGRGSTFTLRLPLRRVETVVPRARADGERRTLADATIVVVAGNPLADATLRALLGGRVGDYIAAATCDDAAARCEAGGVDLVLVEGGPLQAGGDAELSVLRSLAQTTSTAGTAVALLWKPAPGSSVTLDPRVHIVAKPVGGDLLVTILTQILMNRADIDVETSVKGVRPVTVGLSDRRRAAASA